MLTYNDQLKIVKEFLTLDYSLGLKIFSGRALSNAIDTSIIEMARRNEASQPKE